MTAARTSTAPERTARAYIAASNRNDQRAMADLFHDDATCPIAPIEPRTGRAAIAEGYLSDVKAMNAPIVDDVYIADDRRCVLEFVVEHPDYGRVAIVDVFDVDADGLITRLAVYRR